MFEEEKRTTKLKDLPSHLEYASLDNDQEFTVIISSLLSTQEKEVLLGVLTKHKSALAWKVVDIKDFMEVFMNDFSAFRNSFNSFLDNLSKMLARRCIFGKELHEILEHCHTGLTRGHYGADITARKVFESGFYWPTLFMDSALYVRECDACQRAWNIFARSQMPLTNIIVSEVFDIWGIDFMGTFLLSRNNRYILVVVDYISKWVETEALPTNDARVIVKFLQKLFSRFGVPKSLISDRGTHYCNSLLDKNIKRYGVKHRISTPYHPRISGQTENTNRAIKHILERTVNENRKEWVDKLDDALCVFRTAYKAPIRSTPFQII
nr:reverse transcriptase domain-containing protein [Tanacetum cinerariifolium]